MWFDAPDFCAVRVERGSDRRRLSTGDVLTRIDAPVDWQWCSPILNRGLGRSGIGPQAYNPLGQFSQRVSAGRGPR
ncbi:MAG: hypothetical protein GDA36_05145 [Rhodobacteraceae bacterium]|nr:hypothetical protein [Paracoccaceae bacterium]